MSKTRAWFVGAASAALYGVMLCTAKAQTKANMQQDQKGPERLKFVLVLTRHGVRSPTWINARLDKYSAQPWPTWPVAPGLLTPHGKRLMTQFGSYYHETFAHQGLLLGHGCDDEKLIYIRADTDERTLETGRGLANGMLPGCNIAVHSLGEEAQDALFHAIGKVGTPNNLLARSAVSGRIGDAPGALLPSYEMPLKAMQAILARCGKEPCSSVEKEDFLAIPPSLLPGTGDHLAELKGPLTTGATFAEDFQLEYLEGMPNDQVGWGRVDETTERSLMALHAASSDLVQRTPYIASVQASNLLFHIVQTIDQAEQGKPVAGAIGDPTDKVVFLVGHDTNLSNVAALLDAHWLVDGYQRDDAAPGGAIVFELWQKDGSPEILRTYYTVQSPEQMRKELNLTRETPPRKAAIFLPGCSQAESGASCLWTNFDRMLRDRIDENFVER